MKLPHVSGKHTVQTLIKIGFIIHRTHGSHYILKNPQTNRRVTVPYHRKQLAPKTLRSIINQSGVSQEEFVSLL